jgi:hypothetical protein
VAKEFCPPSCGLITEDSPVCRNDCFHKDDMAFKNPFTRMVFGKLELIVGMNRNEYYVEDGGLVHKSQVGRRS